MRVLVNGLMSKKKMLFLLLCGLFLLVICWLLVMLRNEGKKNDQLTVDLVEKEKKLTYCVEDRAELLQSETEVYSPEKLGVELNLLEGKIISVNRWDYKRQSIVERKVELRTPDQSQDFFDDGVNLIVQEFEGYPNQPTIEDGKGGYVNHCNRGDIQTYFSKKKIEFRRCLGQLSYYYRLPGKRVRLVILENRNGSLGIDLDEEEELILKSTKELESIADLIELYGN